jgi:hypothetical protein
MVAKQEFLPTGAIPRITTSRLVLRELRRGDFDAYAEDIADRPAYLSSVDRRTAWRMRRLRQDGLIVLGGSANEMEWRRGRPLGKFDRASAVHKFAPPHGCRCRERVRPAGGDASAPLTNRGNEYASVVKQTVRKGRWLYAGAVESDVRILRSDERLFEYGEDSIGPPFFYVEWRAAGKPEEIASTVGAFATIHAAVEYAQNAAGGNITWET